MSIDFGIEWQAMRVGKVIMDVIKEILAFNVFDICLGGKFRLIFALA